MSEVPKVVIRSVLLGAVLLELCALATEPVAAAQAERQIQTPLAVPNDPLVVTRVTLGDSEVQAGRFIKQDAIDPVTPFQADDDWLQNLTIYVLNRTNKPIVYVRIGLGFPESPGAHILSHLTLGRIPQNALFDDDGKPFQQRLEQQPILFPPGQTMAIRFADFMDRVGSDVASTMSLTRVKRLVLYLGPIYFQNGMKYAAGGFKTPDPQNRGHWLRMGQGYFPGRSDENWPGRKLP